MFHLIGKYDCYSIAETLIQPWLPDAGGVHLENWSIAYARYLRRLQPLIPPQPSYGVQIVDDAATEEALIAAFYNPSPLDDLDYYRDDSYFDTSPQGRADADVDRRWVTGQMYRFHFIEPEFWNAFDFFVTYLMCLSSKFAYGGTDSAAIGAIFLSSPHQYTQHDLYEILVHEFTHTVMFLDERVSPHYANESLMPDEENFARAAISGRARPLDKVLHSLVVATELLLHRERALGHDAPTQIHPPTKVLIDGALQAAESLFKLPRRDELLASRGLELTALCYETLTELA